MSQGVAFSDLRVWPEGIVLPQVKVIPVGCRLEEGEDGTVCLLPAVPQNVHVDVLPDEFYLRELADLDLDSEKEILEFVAKFGRLYLPEPPRPFASRKEALALADDIQSNPDVWPDYYGEPDILPELYDDPAVIRAHLGSPVRGAFGVTSLDEFRLTAMLLRDMTRIMQADAGALTVEELFRAWESPLTFARPNTREDAIAQFGCWVEAGLEGIHPTVSHYEGFEAGEPPRTGRTTYEAVCVQFFNKLASGTGFRRCGNSTCNRLFGRQRTEAGMSRPGQWSEEATGLTYCSPECAQAQASRERRNRIRTATRLYSEGLTSAEIATHMKADVHKVDRWIAAGAKRR